MNNIKTSISKIYYNGTLISDTNYTYLWKGQFSTVRNNGLIMKHIETCLKKYKDSVLSILQRSDGDFHLENNPDKDNILNIIKYYNPLQKIIIFTLAQKTEDTNLNYIYLPLDDDFFKNGVVHYFQNLPKWEDKLPIAFWRGGCSGGGIESARCRTAKELLNYKYTDVKCIKRENWHIGKSIPEEYFGNEVNYTEYYKYKIVLIIDGNVIASSHMWCFAIGSVPLIISNAKCWFSDLLKPYINYIPINYDLSNLKETIEWLISNDDKAKEIAQNALQFAKDY